MSQEYLGPVHDALREFEEAVKRYEKFSFESEVIKRQEADRAREKVIEAVITMAKKLEGRG
ncbi:MAG: hypothetical protein WD934_02585 [Gemmatimonadales bacterium]